MQKRYIGKGLERVGALDHFSQLLLLYRLQGGATVRGRVSVDQLIGQQSKAGVLMVIIVAHLCALGSGLVLANILVDYSLEEKVILVRGVEGALEEVELAHFLEGVGLSGGGMVGSMSELVDLEVELQIEPATVLC